MHRILAPKNAKGIERTVHAKPSQRRNIEQQPYEVPRPSPTDIDQRTGRMLPPILFGPFPAQLSTLNFCLELRRMRAGTCSKTSMEAATRGCSR